MRKRHPPAGASPGTLAIHDGLPRPRLSVTEYTAETHFERDDVDVQDVAPPAQGKAWIDVRGLGDEAVLRALAERFEIHRLALEDLVNVPVRAKSELYADHLLVIAHRVRRVDGDLLSEQVSLILREDCLLSFQERADDDLFDSVEARLRSGKGLARQSGPDYLAYALLDVVIDAYFPIVEEIEDELEDLEDRALLEPGPEVLHELNRVKGQLAVLKRVVAPQRDAVRAMIRDENDFVSETVRVYLRDVLDHVIHVLESIESSREMVASLVNLYLSALSQRTNDVMRVLTIVASIFVPLTFLAGIYGMNFPDMPGLHKSWGYPILMAAMVTVAVAMLLFFRRKGWLSGPGDDV